MSGETQQAGTHHDGHGHQGHGHEGPGRRPGALDRLRHHIEHVVKPHSHEAADKVDAAMESSREGMRALWISLGVLGVTALAQAVVVVWSGSVALLGDTLHNAADALTAVPLGIAFTLGRRAPTRRYTYGYGRAEDLAGVVIVCSLHPPRHCILLGPGRLRSDPPAGQPTAGQSSMGGRRRRCPRLHR